MKRIGMQERGWMGREKNGEWHNQGAQKETSEEQIEVQTAKVSKSQRDIDGNKKERGGGSMLVKWGPTSSGQVKTSRKHTNIRM